MSYFHTGFHGFIKGLKRRFVLKKGVALLLSNNLNIAVVVSPFCLSDNSAYIYSPDGNVKWDVGNIVRCNYKNVVFSDVYYIFDMLYFFANIEGHDYRFSFDIDTGKVGNIIASI